MNCREFEDWILESLDLRLDGRREGLLAEHVSQCDSCRRFQAVQHALDRGLVEHCVTPPLDAGLSAAVRHRAARESRGAIWDLAPDLLHLGGGAVCTLVTSWLLPGSSTMVLGVGLGLTVLTYLPYTFFRGAIEAADDTAMLDRGA